MKKVLILLVIPLLSSCANVLGASTVISPRNVDKDNLKSLQEVTTPIYALRVNFISTLSNKKEEIVNDVDSKFSEFSKCMNIKDNGVKVRSYLISVLDGAFNCKYHGGRCNGEYDADKSLIIVTYKAFNREGILPLLKHEWAHAYGFLKSDDSNLDEIQRCTNY